MPLNRLAFNWGVSSFYGWGVYGMNLALQIAAQRPDIELLCASQFRTCDVVLDPLRERTIAALAERSAPFLRRITAHPRPVFDAGHAVLRALGKDLQPADASTGKSIVGKPQIGVLFMEEATITKAAHFQAEGFRLIVCGSTWNERMLRDQGVTNVVTVLQGVDTSIFHPAPKANLFPGRFVVFSGGKLEYRKGQDIVLKAFKAFHDRHPEAMLLTAWHSPWPELAAEIGCPLGDGGQPAVTRWAVENGIPAQVVVSIGATPNIAMAHVIREADVALFPNRAEGGTNLAAMECMACGIPTILSANTGHEDLLTGGAWPLASQGTVRSDRYDTSGWGETDVDEACAALQWAFDTGHDADVADTGTDLMQGHDWRVQIARLLREIEGVTG